jgi:hypothetical protein
MCRRPRVFRPAPATPFLFFSYSSTLRDCPAKFALVQSGGLFSSTAHLLILMAALKSRFTNSIRFVPSLVVLTDASNPRTFALLSICPSGSGPYFFVSSGLRWHFSISTLWSVHPSSWCVYDVRNSSTGIVSKRRARSLYVLVVGAGVVPFWVFHRPAPYATMSL